MGGRFAKPKCNIFRRFLDMLGTATYIFGVVCPLVFYKQAGYQIITKPRSVGFCVISLLSLVWIDQGTHTPPTHTSKVDLALNSTLISLVVLYLIFQFYRIRKLIAK